MRAQFLLLIAATLVVPCVGLAQPSESESSAEVTEEAVPDSLTGIEAISTTINRRPMDVQDVAGSISAFDEELMRSINLDNSEDLVFLTPNVVTKSGRFGSISVRGIGTGLTSQGAVALHTDGIFSGPNSFYDVEGVEFVRGPSGSLYGRNATAGAINIRTNKPTDRYEVFGEVDVANYDQLRIRGGVNIPLLGEGDDTLAFRGTIQSNRYDGWVDNVFETRSEDPANGDEFSFAGGVRWKPTEDFDVWIRGGYAKLANDVTPSRPLINRYPVGVLPTGALPAGFGTLTSDPYAGFAGLISDLNNGVVSILGVPAINVIAGINGLTFDQQVAAILQNGLGVIPAILPMVFRDQSVIGQSALPLFDDPSKVRTGANLRGEPKIRRWNFNGEVNWHVDDVPVLGDVQASLRGGVFDTTANVFIDLDGTELQVLDIARDNGFQRWTGEFQLASENDESPIDWVAGFFFFEERTEFSQDITTPFTRLLESNTGRERGLAPFAHFFWDFAEDWTLDGGVRWSKDIVEVDLARPAAGIARPVGFTYDAREVYRERTGDVSLTWRWHEDRSLYVKWVKGYRPGGVNSGDGVAAPDSTLTPAERARIQSFAPEFVKAWEVGSKNLLFDGLLELNLVAFLYDYTSIQVPTVSVEGVFTSNAGSATIRGVEADLRVPLPILDGGLFVGSVGYLHARYDEFCSDDPFQITAVSDPECDPATTAFDAQTNIKDHHLPDAPRWSASFFAFVNKDLGDLGSLRFTVKSSFRDEYFRRHFNVREIDRIGSMTRTDIRIIWSSPEEHWSIHLYVENLEGGFVFANALVGPEITGGLPVGLNIPLSPRIYGVQMEFQFGRD